MEKVKEKVLENKVYNFFIARMPEMKDYLSTNENACLNGVNYPIDEFKTFNFDEYNGQGQDAVYLEMTSVVENIVSYFIEQVKENNADQIKTFIDVVEPFISNFQKDIIDQTTLLSAMFIDTLFDYIDYYVKKDLQSLQKLGLKNKTYYKSLTRQK